MALECSKAPIGIGALSTIPFGSTNTVPLSDQSQGACRAANLKLFAAPSRWTGSADDIFNAVKRFLPRDAFQIWCYRHYLFRKHHFTL